jgi:hypothetical protein
MDESLAKSYSSNIEANIGQEKKSQNSDMTYGTISVTNQKAEDTNVLPAASRKE